MYPTSVGVLHVEPEGEIAGKEFRGWGWIIQGFLWCEEEEDIFSVS